MKKLLVFVVICTVSAFMLAISPSLANNNNNKNISEYCAERGDLGLTHGGCVAYFTANNIVPHDASVCKNPVMQRIVGAKNHGECMKNMKNMK